MARASESPRYVAIAAEIRDTITNERLDPHTPIASERDLSERHGVSRMTARHALALLESEGFVYRRPPHGTFVSEPRVAFHIASFSDEISRLGRTPGAVVLWAEERKPTRSVREALGLTANATVHALQRLRSADGEPIAIETTYVPAALTPGLLEQDLGGSLWAVLREEYTVLAVSATASIQSVVIDDDACKLLGVRSASAGMLLTRRTYDADGRAIEFARDIYRADRASFEVEALIPAPR
ncbi:MAG: yvoA 2 [Nocardioidaceae bacterium]|nr:yvoA 2 [Nocardioidaceae bacterium]